MNILNIYNELDSHNFDLNVDHYGAEQCDKGYSFGPTIRDNFVLHFITKGRGKILVDGKTSYLAAGDLFILPKDVSIFTKLMKMNLGLIFGLVLVVHEQKIYLIKVNC